MNKRQLIKYGDVIKWLVDNYDKGLWTRNELNKDSWRITYDFSLYSGHTYVQNDEYAEFRKALKDGKTIEYSLPTTEQWNVVDNSKQHFSDCFKYRVKPEEPKFKVGDWVRIKHFEKIVQLKGQPFCKPNAIYVEELNTYFFLEDIELWQPKQNELCVFWNNNYTKNFYSVGPYKFLSNSLYCDSMSTGWDNIAPLEFIETLKEIRNEKV